MVKKKVEELSGYQVVGLSWFHGCWKREYNNNNDNNHNNHNNDNKIAMTTPTALIQPVRHF